MAERRELALKNVYSRDNPTPLPTASVESSTYARYTEGEPTRTDDLKDLRAKTDSQRT